MSLHKNPISGFSSKIKNRHKIYDIFKVPFISYLLKNDCIIFGDFIVNYMLDEHYIDSNNVHCFAKKIFMDIIERDIYPYTILNKTLNTPEIYLCTIKYYKLNINNVYYDLYINYVTDLRNIDNYVLSSNILFYSDLICLKRTGLSILSYYDETYNEILKNVPVPFLEILNTIYNKKFAVISPINTASNFKRISQLVKRDWKNEHSIVKYTKKQDIICNICKEKNNKKWLVELPCKHHFHRDCWFEHIKYTIKPSVINIICPNCRETYSLVNMF